MNTLKARSEIVVKFDLRISIEKEGPEFKPAKKKINPGLLYHNKAAIQAIMSFPEV